MGMARNLRLLPWIRFCQSLLFWQATWFLYFQSNLSAGQAILLYAVFDLASTLTEVPSGYLSDRLGRRRTLVVAAATLLAGSAALGLGDGFGAALVGQALLGAGFAIVSGTDSAITYESLPASGRETAIEAMELRLYRFGFVALALSALIGGAMAMFSLRLPFLASALASAVMLALTLLLVEPARHLDHSAQGAEIADPSLRAALGRALRQPALRWLFAAAVLAYVLSHLPFVFGQPFIEDALAGIGIASGAPMVSGVVTAAMMLLSVAVSLVAPALRRRVGIGPVVIVALLMQIGLIAGLALSGSVWIIGLLVMRMVPDALSRPYIAARTQPLLEDGLRATWLSLQGLVARLVLGGSLLVASAWAGARDRMDHDQIAVVLGVYALAGVAAVLTLAATRRRARIDVGTGASQG